MYKNNLIFNMPEQQITQSNPDLKYDWAKTPKLPAPKLPALITNHHETA